MPELPEVETTLQGLKPHILNQKIIKVEVRNPNLRWAIADDFASCLSGALVESMHRRAKYLVVKLNTGYWVTHLGMSGSLSFHDSGSSYLKHDHIIIDFQNSKQLRYNDPRRFGSMMFVEELKSLRYLQQLGPEPLLDSFNATYLLECTQRSSRPIKSLIMDQKVVVGVGNIYAAEALFLSKIHPARPAKALTYDHCQILIKNIQNCLRRSIALGGTTLKDFVNPDNRSGYFQQTLAVYGKEGGACPICRGIIKSIRLNQRASAFCEHCQPEK